jgi:hypothetical protein
MRVAASSMARGSPSSRWQISASGCRFSAVTAKPGWILREAVDARQPDQVGQGQRRHEELVFADDAQRRAAGAEEFERRRRSQQGRDLRRCGQQMLQVVEHQQHFFAAQPVGQRRGERTPAVEQIQGLGDGRQHAFGAAHRRQRCETDAFVKAPLNLPGDRQGQPRLAHTGRADQGDEAHIGVEEQLYRGFDRVRPAQQRAGSRGQGIEAGCARGGLWRMRRRRLRADKIDRRAVLCAGAGEGDEGRALFRRHRKHGGHLFGQLFGGAQIVRLQPAHSPLGAEETRRQLGLGEVEFPPPLAQPCAE